MIKAAIELQRAVAQIEYKRAVATIKFNRAVATAQLLRPLSAVEFRRAIAAIEFGEFMHFKFATDPAFIADAIAKHYAKNVTETPIVADLLSKTTSKTHSEATALVDAFDIVPSKIIVDSAALLDGYQAVPHKRVLEQLGLADTAAKDFTTNRSDAFSVSDLASKQPFKSFAESTEIADNYTAVLTKRPNEILGLSIATTRHFEKTIVDNVEIQHIFRIPDKLLGSDIAGVSYAQAIFLSRSFSDTFTANDSISLESRKIFNNSVNTTCSGSLVSQGYCDLDYFAEDYVGARRGWLDSKSENETPAAADNLTLATSKQFADNAGFVDTHISAFEKHRSDAATVADQATKLFGRSPNETIDAFHSGKLRSQSYCDISYFAEDYVGESRNFAEIKVLYTLTPAATHAMTITASKGFAHASSIADQNILTAGKVFAESLQIADDFISVLTKRPSEMIGLSIATANELSKNRAQQTALTDSRAIDVFKTHAETAAITDTAINALTKARTETPAVTDLAAKATAKSFSESNVIVDSQVIAASKPLDDSASIVDLQTRVLTKNASEVPVVTDVVDRDTVKPLAETPAIADQLAKQASKPLADSSAVSDLQTLNAIKSLTESPAITDSGSVRSQGYCDYTYFAEDYVGSRQTF